MKNMHKKLLNLEQHAQLNAAELTWLQSQAPTCQYSNDVYLCHGTPACDLEYFLETVDAQGIRPATLSEVTVRIGSTQSSLMACGHSHVPRIVRTPNGQTLVNPGSVGLPAYRDTRPFVHAIEAGSPDARYAIAERSTNGWDVELIAIAYNHCAMEQLALQRNRPEWAYALRTGYAT